MTLKYEFQKILTKKFVLIIFLCYSLYAIFGYISCLSDFSYKQYYGDEQIRSLYSAYYHDPNTVQSEYDALIQKLELLSPEEQNSAEMRPLMDEYRLYRKLMSDVSRKETYQTDIASVIRQAQYHLLSYDNENISNDSYTYMYQEQVISRFSEAYGSVYIGFEHYAGWDLFFSDRNLSAYLYIMLIGYLVLHFYQDKRAGNDVLIYPTKNGRKQYVLSKYISHCLFLIAGVLVGEMVRLLMIYNYYGLSSPLNNIQAFSCFTMNPYNISILRYLIMYILVKFLISLTLFSTGLLIFLLVRHVAVFLAAYVGAFAINTILHTWSAGEYGPNGLFSIHTFLQQYRMINLLGNAISSQLFFTGCCSITAVISVLIILNIYASRSISVRPIIKLKRSHEDVGLKNHTHTVNHLSLVRHELYKQLVLNKKVVLLVAVAVIACIIQWSECEEQQTYMEQLYHEYISEVEGEYSADKEQYLIEQYICTQETIALESEMMKQYAERTLPLEEYREYLNDLYQASTSQYIYVDLIKKSMVLKEQLQENNILGSYVYETGYQLINQSDGNSVLFAVIIVLSGTMYLIEHQSRNNTVPMLSIIRTTRTGETRLRKLKYCIVLFLNLLLIIIVALIRFIMIEKLYPMDNLFAAVSSLSGMEYIVFDITILTFYVLYFVYFMLVLAALNALLLFISVKSKNELVTVMIVLAFILPIPINRIFDISMLSMIDMSSLAGVSHFSRILQGDYAAILSSAITLISGMFAAVRILAKRN